MGRSRTFPWEGHAHVSPPRHSSGRSLLPPHFPGDDAFGRRDAAAILPQDDAHDWRLASILPVGGFERRRSPRCGSGAQHGNKGDVLAQQTVAPARPCAASALLIPQALTNAVIAAVIAAAAAKIDRSVVSVFMAVSSCRTGAAAAHEEHRGPAAPGGFSVLRCDKLTHSKLCVSSLNLIAPRRGFC